MLPKCHVMRLRSVCSKACVQRGKTLQLALNQGIPFSWMTLRAHDLPELPQASSAKSSCNGEVPATSELFKNVTVVDFDHFFVLCDMLLRHGRGDWKAGTATCGIGGLRALKLL